MSEITINEHSLSKPFQKEDSTKEDLFIYYGSQKPGVQVSEDIFDQIPLHAKFGFDEAAKADQAESPYTLISQLLESRGYLASEKWSDVISVQSIIRAVSNTHVTVECLIDPVKTIFEVRAFPRPLFSNLSTVSAGTPVYIKLYNKPGSIRIDVFDGKGLVDTKLFDAELDWKDLMNANLDSQIKIS